MPAAIGAGAPAAVTETTVRAHMGFLASDALHGRGSGTRDEWIAATYIASQFARMGLEPMGDAGTYVQTIEFSPPGAAKSQKAHTWNAVARLPGADPELRDEVILLTAHLDHLGDRAKGADAVYNGADDDASGTIAVLALAEALASGPRPKRTVVFALFGSEELGGFGSKAFLDRSTVELDKIVANLEFEMIGRPDAAVAPHTLWLTGWERTNLGPELAKHGARLVGDPHPEQSFFTRSDNIHLARSGVIAQTVSSFGLHADYHQPSDDIAHIDFAHMTEAIQSMQAPIEWLANSGFRPQWVGEGRPK